MLTFGEQLYRLTARDEETLLVEPYFRNINVAVAPASLTATATSTPQIPNDRMLYLDGVYIEASPGVAQTCAAVGLFLTQPAGFSTTLLGLAGLLTGDGNAAAVANTIVCFNFRPKVVLPPGAFLTCSFTKSAAANVGSANFFLSGYLIPPGRVGRTF